MIVKTYMKVWKLSQENLPESRETRKQGDQRKKTRWPIWGTQHNE